MAAEKERVLVLAVDRDGDIEAKTQVRTPIVGREAVISAATQLSLADPEEADANAIFGAVREYDRLATQGLNSEVAVVCGLRQGGFAADRKLRREVDDLVRNSNYTGLVLVSDGVDDEQTLPILQSMIPIVSVVRIVVKHSARLEETYLILGRYLRMLIFDPRYSKWSIGIPGLIFLLFGVLVLLNRAFEAAIATLLIIGGAFLIRGFNIDRSIATMLGQRPYGYIRIFTILASLLLVGVGVSSGFSNLSTQIPVNVQLVEANPALFLVYGAGIIGYFLQGGLGLIWVALAVYLVGALLTHLVRGSVRAWREAVLIVILGLLYLPFNTFASYLIDPKTTSSVLLISYILFGLAILFGVVTTVYGHIRTRTATLKE
jgi:putative membrane protein